LEQEYARQYRSLYQKHWWWRAREEAVIDLLRRKRLTPNLKILDVGCGDALFFNRLAEFGDVEGIEADSRLVDPRSPDRSRIYIQPFDQKFQPGKRYDLILMLDVLEHLKNPAEALGCVRDLLNHYGIFLLTVPAFQILWTNHDVLNHHHIRYRKKTLIPLLHHQKFRVLSTQYWFQWIAPIKLAMHFAQKLTSTDLDPPRVPSNSLNKFFFYLSRLEQRSIGPLMPFGTSLMAMCQRAEEEQIGKSSAQAGRRPR
jgi:2-polyprenyl-3-methyl-5-hydroxy-6-metoxy-1,4-benzoquinol methylase